MNLKDDALEKVFIHPTAVVDDQIIIGEGTKIWHFSHILENTVIGKKCNMGQNVVAGPDVTIGDGCKIQNNVSVYKGVTLEDNVFCGPSMVFTNVLNPRSHINKMKEVRKTLVKTGATLGANCTIVCGVTIGKYAFVGAGAVVTKDVPDFALVTGNPARQTGWMCECGEKLSGTSACAVCGKENEKKSSFSLSFVDLASQQKKIFPDLEKRIMAVLKHGRYIMGPEVSELETRLAEYINVRHAVSCSSGTDALFMALMAYGIGPGDAVLTTPFTFIATAEVIRLIGATPVFVDIDPVTYNISPRKLEQAFEKLSDKSKLIAKAVIPVDLFGLPCDYDEIMRISSAWNAVVIQDAAQSFGSEYKGRKAGALGDIGCTSFFPAKPLGCYGDGGAVFTDSDEIADRLRSIRIHGKGKDKYDNIRLGINGRLDTIQAAVLLSKFQIFPDEIKQRQKAAEIYEEKLVSVAGKKLILPKIPAGYKSAWAQYSLLAEDQGKRNQILEAADEQKIPLAVYYPKPLHLQTAFEDLGYRQGDFPLAEACSERIFSLPIHPYLTKEDQNRICKFLESSL